MKLLAMLLRRLALQVLLLLTLFFISRLAFTLINYSHFSGLGTGGFLRLAFHGIRYDLSAICAVNALYIFLLFLPIPVWRWPRWQKATQLLFVAVNSLVLMFDVSDWAYFPYNFKRSTADVLRIITRKGDFWSVLPDYLLSFWYVPLADFSLILIIILANRRVCWVTHLDAVPDNVRARWIRPLLQSAALIILLCAAAIGIRGGMQYIPIGLRNAVQVTDSRYVPVVLNAPFSIITTLAAPSLEELHYLPDSTAERLMPFHHQYRGGRTSGRKNVVLVILESGSKEFTALGGRRSFTPFLDSLMGLSLTCTQAFANGQTSAEGIPAVIAGIPTLMDEAFTTSNYGTNNISTLPGLLKEEGYSTAFYHGGTNGTMSFDIFAAAAGFQRYYGRSEYANETDYDGAWGIRDEPFLQYFAKGLSKMKQPFAASVFTLAAHPPYGLPEQYRSAIPSGPLPVQQCIAYTDLALRLFFRQAAGQAWYRNTLFIVTADHASPQTSGGFYEARPGQYAIPILFYCPSDSTLRGYYNAPTQQLDIVPSALQYLGYSKSFFAFGNSIFSPAEQRFVITHAAGSYQWLEDGHLLQTSGEKPAGYFSYPGDSLCKSDLRGQKRMDTSLLRLRAFIQRYRYALTHNAMN